MSICDQQLWSDKCVHVYYDLIFTTSSVSFADPPAAIHIVLSFAANHFNHKTCHATTSINKCNCASTQADNVHHGLLYALLIPSSCAHISREIEQTPLVIYGLSFLLHFYYIDCTVHIDILFSRPPTTNASDRPQQSLPTFFNDSI